MPLHAPVTCSAFDLRITPTRARHLCSLLAGALSLLMLPAAPTQAQGNAPNLRVTDVKSYRRQLDGEAPDWTQIAFKRHMDYIRHRKSKGGGGPGAMTAPPPGAASVAAPEQVLVANDEDSLGFTHTRSDQTHNGVPVFGGGLITETDPNGNIVNEFGNIYDEANSVDTTPFLADWQAIAAAKNALGNQGPFVDTPAATLVLVPCPVRLPGQQGPTLLCWQVNLRTEDDINGVHNYQYFVDAINGSIVWVHDTVCSDDNRWAVGHTLYVGDVYIPVTFTYSVGPSRYGNYLLKDQTRGGTQTSNLNSSATNISQLVIAASPGVFGDYSSGNVYTLAADAHYANLQTWEFYYNSLGRTGWDGRGRGAECRVQWYDSVYGPNNSVWNGSAALIGNGDNFGYRPFVSLDIVGHEISHGMTQSTANLTFQNESGALNESFSDIFGTGVEFYASVTNANVHPNYLIGENTTAGGFRDMSNPPTHQHPDNYLKRTILPSGQKPTLANDYGGVHTNSSIQNKVFYLVAEGGRFTNSYTGQVYTITGLGRQGALAVFYRALSKKLNKDARFVDAKKATVSAAEDIYGKSSSQRNQVYNAWQAVSVPDN